MITDAWIITGGTDAGVMKYVGEAVGTHLKAQGRGSRVVTIGVATWGIVMGKKDLIKEEVCDFFCNTIMLYIIN